MNLFKELGLEPTRKEPDVWVRRLVIYKQITPDPVVIREVTLSKGLNVVWAEEREDEDATAEINGHSAGKTTFCRFLRYVLGEKTYGTKANMDLIRKSLPAAYVAAELFVRQQQWAVIRPIGNGRRSYILTDATIEELLKCRNHAAYLEDYPLRIGLDALLDDFETGSIVRTGELIEWGHILAWCTRDQESRFQNIYEWRSPRSESDWPNFRFSKVDPLFVIRATLGLFLPDELKGEERLANLLNEQDNLEKELGELKKEPQFTVNFYDRELRRLLKKVFSDELAIEMATMHSDSLQKPGLDRLSRMAKEQMESEIKSLEKQRGNYQDSIDESGARICDLEKTFKHLEHHFEIETAVGNELDDGIAQRNQARILFEKFGDGKCRLGNVLYTECTHVKELQGILRYNQIKDERAMQAAQAEAVKLQRKLNDEKEKITQEIKELRKEREETKRKRQGVLDRIEEKRGNIRELSRAYQELETWAGKPDVSKTFPRLVECRTKLENTKRKIDELKRELGKLLTEHDTNRKLLTAIFSGSVRSVLQSGTYDGRVNFSNRELAFMITHGPAMSGEAIETLSVLLADVATLVFTSVSDKSRHPGFLLHDSPREADLGNRIYRSFIRFVASLQDAIGGPEACPFQYILTTTTAPPKELQTEKTVKLQLNAADKNGLLLRQNLALDEATAQITPLFSFGITDAEDTSHG